MPHEGCLSLSIPLHYLVHLCIKATCAVCKGLRARDREAFLSPVGAWEARPVSPARRYQLLFISVLALGVEKNLSMTHVSQYRWINSAMSLILMLEGVGRMLLSHSILGCEARPISPKRLTCRSYKTLYDNSSSISSVVFISEQCGFVKNYCSFQLPCHFDCFVNSQITVLL